MTSPSPVTMLLAAVQHREAEAEDRLLAAVYDHLHGMAARLVAREGNSCAVQATMLVHDAWMELVGSKETAEAPGFSDRMHFFRAAARAMRNLLVDEARTRKRLRRGGGRRLVTLGDLPEADTDVHDERVLELHAALEELDGKNPHLARLVELRYFTGLTIDEVAAALERSPATVKRDWTYARAWLHERLSRPTAE